MSPPSPTLPTPTVPSDTVRRPLSPRSMLRDFHSRRFPSHPIPVRFMGPRPTPISGEMREMDRHRSSFRRPILNDPFFSIFERTERRGEDRSPHRMNFSSRFDHRPFFSSERVERRRDENNIDEEYKKLMEAIRAAKGEKGEKGEKDGIVDGAILPVNERSSSPNEESEASNEEKKNNIPEGELVRIETPETITRTSIKSHQILGPDGKFQLVFARCEKTVEENGKVITLEKEDYHFAQ